MFDTALQKHEINKGMEELSKVLPLPLYYTLVSQVERKRDLIVPEGEGPC